MDVDTTSDTQHASAADAQPEVTAREKLKVEVAALIKPHEELEVKPPFSAEELIVAILVLSDKPLTKEETLLQLLRRFQYYWSMAFTTFAQGEAFSYYRFDRPRRQERFREAFKCYELPVHESLNTDRNTIYRVDANEARIFFRNRLEPPRKGTFPFLSLSAELRNIIYELMLSFNHDDGFFLDCDPISLRLLQRSNGTRMACGALKWHTYQGRQPRLCFKPPIAQALAIAATCKQIHPEATSCFYAFNSFTFTGFAAALNWSSRVPDDAIKHLSSITIQCLHRPRYKHIHPSTFRCFDLIKSLRQFTLEFTDCDDSCWLKLYAHERKHLHAISLQHVPGIYDLAALAAKAETYNLIGDFPLFEVFIKRAIQRIKAGSTVREVMEADNDFGTKSRSDEAHLATSAMGPRRSARVAAQKST